MSNEHNFYMDMDEGATVIEGFNNLAVTRDGVANDVYLEVAGRGTEFFAAVDANELRDAIDKAVGPREKTDGQAAIDYAADSWYEIKNHDFFDDCYDMDSIAHHKIVKKLDILVGAERAGAKAARPYRPIDRDRLLRHIEDVEAALTRRNERWEKDQARIRELEAEVHTLREIKDSYEEPKTTREYLQMAWENATVPEDGMVYDGEPCIVAVDGKYAIAAAEGDAEAWNVDPVSGIEGPIRLLDPRVDPMADEKRRAEYEAQGLKGWEIELLMEASMS